AGGGSPARTVAASAPGHHRRRHGAGLLRPADGPQGRRLLLAADRLGRSGGAAGHRTGQRRERRRTATDRMAAPPRRRLLLDLPGPLPVDLAAGPVHPLGRLVLPADRLRRRPGHRPWLLLPDRAAALGPGPGRKAWLFAIQGHLS